jgi:hypothetical protein
MSFRSYCGIIVKYCVYTLVLAAIIGIAIVVATADIQFAYAVLVNGSISCPVGRLNRNATDIWYDHRDNCQETIEYEIMSTNALQVTCDKNEIVRVICPLGSMHAYGTCGVTLQGMTVHALLVKHLHVDITNKCDHFFQEDPPLSCPEGYECHREIVYDSQCLKRCLLGKAKSYIDYAYQIDTQTLTWYNGFQAQLVTAGLDDETVTVTSDVNGCNSGFVIVDGQTYCLADLSLAPSWIRFQNQTFSHYDIVQAIRSLVDTNARCNEQISFYREPVFSDKSGVSVLVEITGKARSGCGDTTEIKPCSSGVYTYYNGTFIVNFNSLCLLNDELVTGTTYIHCSGCNNDCTWSVKGNGENKNCTSGKLPEPYSVVTEKHTLGRKLCGGLKWVIIAACCFLGLQWLYISYEIFSFVAEYRKAKEEVQLMTGIREQYISSQLKKVSNNSKAEFGEKFIQIMDSSINPKED